VGGGYIGVEFACIFRGYGAEVDVVIRGDKVLRGFEEDCRDFIMTEFEKKERLTVLTGTQVESVSKQEDGRLTVTYDSGAVVKDVDVVLSATGRKPKLDGLGLDKAGVEVAESGFIKVDREQRTSVDNIFACGDCTDTLQLTPAALAEGHCFADTQFGCNPRTADLEDVATAVFTQPPLGTVGLTEAQAVEKYGTVCVFKSDFRPLKHTVSGSTERNFIKMIVNKASDRVVGVHIIGHAAGEIIQGVAIAIKCGATKKQFDSTIGVHPTMAEKIVTMRSMAYEKSKD
jgi:glutathione reductase (NADPH)